MSLTDRASLLREFYRLTGITGSDRAAFINDSTTLEGVYDLLQRGLWDAQIFLIDAGEGHRWLKTATLDTWVDASYGQYHVLPSDYLRMVGDGVDSSLHYATGRPWGTLIDLDERYRRGINCYWLQGDDDGAESDRLYVTEGTSPPSDLKMDYHFKLGTLADGSTVHFPELFRPLIPAFAAERATYQAWFPLDAEGKAMVMRNLMEQKRKAKSQSRRSRSSRKVRAPRTLGRYWRA